ncbi:hypothetical protein KP79_PYT24395 [Mizuhopecten yessoensis]|uniref:Uncharacterized protein n=2 Tax=Mizuhopecten yessoensis TaxID=6573 RepID=A0A210Q020_MIZYE|nr:hypothetical protein KP79_PYT24395 [Mizuhopecten yessoensis]
MAVSVLVFVCVCFIIKSNSSGLKTNNVIDTDKVQPLDCASDINEEVSHSDNSSEQFRSETGNDGGVSIQVSMEGCDVPLVQYHRQMEPTTSTSDQFWDIYAGEMHINENTEAKTCYDETHC